MELMSESDQSSILRFVCQACGVHLGIDRSLAGLESPCPKCGAKVQAPIEEACEQVSEEGESSALRSVSGEKLASSSGGEVRRRRRSSGSRRSKESGLTRGELRAGFKAVMLISIVALIIFAVIWHLKG